MIPAFTPVARLRADGSPEALDWDVDGYSEAFKSALQQCVVFRSFSCPASDTRPAEWSERTQTRSSAATRGDNRVRASTRCSTRLASRRSCSATSAASDCTCLVVVVVVSVVVDPCPSVCPSDPHVQRPALQPTPPNAPSHMPPTTSCSLDTYGLVCRSTARLAVPLYCPSAALYTRMDCAPSVSIRHHAISSWSAQRLAICPTRTPLRRHTLPRDASDLLCCLVVCVRELRVAWSNAAAWTH